MLPWEASGRTQLEEVQVDPFVDPFTWYFKGSRGPLNPQTLGQTASKFWLGFPLILESSGLLRLPTWRPDLYDAYTLLAILAPLGLDGWPLGPLIAFVIAFVIQTLDQINCTKWSILASENFWFVHGYAQEHSNIYIYIYVYLYINSHNSGPRRSKEFLGPLLLETIKNQ